ncbi:hypothetical protein SCHPADRAFT_994587 [Schizopora paradoxa]|uniref:F-box domain-containing protein n=1 Tax=Schizopora paradoxa TaxID=27342 RepID=A0A0H2S640_9AGAM|nr:hypothetical protein SCHPADRAFT_994587 [Schizopora paradoxa]
MDIPDELTFKILELAVEEHDYSDNAAWCDGAVTDCQWRLTKRTKPRTADSSEQPATDEIETVAKFSDNRGVYQGQIKSSMVSKLAIILTCKRWYGLAIELMYRTIVVGKKISLALLMETLETYSERGKSIRGIFLYHNPRFGLCDVKPDDIDGLLVRLLHLSPNLRALDFEPYEDIGVAFLQNPELLNAIQSLTALKFVSLYIAFETKVPMGVAFSKMPGLLSARLENSSSSTDKYVDADETSPHIYIQALEELALSRPSIHTLNYMATWAMPNLKALELDLGFSESVDDVNAFLRVYGGGLQILSLDAFCDSTTTVDILSILSMCPSLTTFTFNLDWTFRVPLSPFSHPNLTRIGFNTQGSLFVFAEPDLSNPFWNHERPLSPAAIENLSNLDRVHFPRLSTIRVLSAQPLRQYIRQGGMSGLDSSKSAAWISLSQRCSSEGICIEDAAGNDFGKKPFGDETEDGPLKYIFSF